MQTNENNALYLEVQQLYNMLSEAKMSLEEKDKEISMLKEGMDMGKKVLDELSDERNEMAEIVNTYRAKECVRELMVEASEKLTCEIDNILETYNAEGLGVEFNLSWEFQGGND